MIGEVLHTPWKNFSKWRSLHTPSKVTENIQTLFTRVYNTFDETIQVWPFAPFLSHQSFKTHSNVCHLWETIKVYLRKQSIQQGEWLQWDCRYSEYSEWRISTVYVSSWQVSSTNRLIKLVRKVRSITTDLKPFIHVLDTCENCATLYDQCNNSYCKIILFATLRSKNSNRATHKLRKIISRETIGSGGIAGKW